MVNELLAEVIRIAPETIALLLVTGTGVLQRKRLAEVLDRLSGVKVAGLELEFAVERLANARPEHPVSPRDLASLGEHLAKRRPILDGARILWVDDAPLGNSAERALFRQIGATVVNAISTEEAFYWLERDEFDVIISDIDRDGDPVAGLTFTRRISVAPASPVIGYVGTVDRTRATPEGFVTMVDRPDSLFRAVVEALEGMAPSLR